MNKYAIIGHYKTDSNYIFSSFGFYRTKEEAIADAKRNHVTAKAVLDEHDINILRLADKVNMYDFSNSPSIVKHIFNTKDYIIEEMDFRKWEA